MQFKAEIKICVCLPTRLEIERLKRAGEPRRAAGRKNDYMTQII